MQPDFSIEQQYQNHLIIGIDEAGRGPLAGPVVAACAILNSDGYSSRILKKINDSKKLSKKLRGEIFLELIATIQFGIGVVDEKIIDKINILEASKLAMLHAYLNLQKKYDIFPEIILVDGNFFPFEKRDKIQKIIPVIKGDQKSMSIAAASIIAKETRDEIMKKYHQEFPEFDFKKHAGYPTKSHLEAIKQYGICKIHRKTFAPIKHMINISKSDPR